MTEFRYHNDRGAIAILGAIEDMGLDFTHEPDVMEYGSIWVDMELESEFDYIWAAFCKSQLPRPLD